MAEPDVRVNTGDLDAAGAEMVALGSALAEHLRDPATLRTEPAFTDGFDSVAATARLAGLWRDALERGAADVVAQGTAMRAAAEAWRAADDEVAESMRAVERRAG